MINDGKHELRWWHWWGEMIVKEW